MAARSTTAEALENECSRLRHELALAAQNSLKYARRCFCVDTDGWIASFTYRGFILYSLLTIILKYFTANSYTTTVLYLELLYSIK